ncbi:MAG: 50S ribosomal protein L19 [Candidatus Berkelbacteria bacterium Licking1014_85]|uniref:50S ribosomal protein L19 n=1 Tax=Candidatus Berkelbacteria bacterium Licking1014_85 TaxID=2017148 RepID=A0A554LJW2_9BACT|nr:MAG: 50S ribosomal protein L19 [Candidatus Berkelbacteria bacterium Licking1014_85]
MHQIILEQSKTHLAKHNADPRPGDFVKVYQKITEAEKERIQIFEGVVIARKHGKGINATYTVRRIADAGIAVEKVFPLHSPVIVKIERVKTSQVRRAKLYYLRNIKSSTIKLKNEKKAHKVWEDKTAEEELEKIKHEQELEAKKRESEKAKEEAELEKKAEEALKSHEQVEENQP